MVKRPSRVERRQRILEAARAVFARKGYTATRVNDIAREAGVGKGTLYEYFESKEDLFSTLVLVSARDSLEASVIPNLPEDPVAAMHQAISCIVRAALQENLDLYRLFFDFWGVSAPHRREAQSRLREVEGRFREFVVNLVRGGQRTGSFRPEIDAEQFANCFSAAIDGLSMRIILLGEEVDLDAYTACLQESLLGGLLTESALGGASLLKESSQDEN